MQATSKQVSFISHHLFGHTSPYTKQLADNWHRFSNGQVLNLPGAGAETWLEKQDRKTLSSIIALLEKELDEEAFNALVVLGLPLKK